MSLFDLARTTSAKRACRRTGWIGVEVGTRAITVAQVERIAGQFRLARSLVVRAGDKLPFDMQSIEAGRVGRELGEALSLHGGFQGRLAACALSMNFCELRTLVSAQGSEDEQRELISLELDDRSAAGPDTREFDFWDAAQHGEDEQGMTQVHVLSIPRTLSDAIANNLLDAGLKCRVLDAIPFTVLRAVDIGASRAAIAPAAGEAAAVLDWEYSTATLVVMRDDEPLLTRPLRDCGLDRLLEKISQHLKLSLSEAEALLTTCGVENPIVRDAAAGELQSLITDLAGEVLKEVADGVDETLSFLKMQFRGLMPAQLWLAGAGSAIRNIAPRLELQVGVPTTLWDLPGRMADPDQPTSVLANAAALSALAWEL